MTTRYFKATDGKVTVFRGSKTRVYQSASWHPLSFSGLAARGAGWHPTVEIDKVEYDRLIAVKIARVTAEWAGRESERPWWADGGSPQDSWVNNSDIEAAQ